MEMNSSGASLPKNARVQAEMEAAAEENAVNPITIDESSFQQIPNHLVKILESMVARKLLSQLDLINGLVLAVAVECGFVGDWCCCDDFKTYALSWSFSFCRQLLTDFASYPPKPQDDNPLVLKFTFSLQPQHSITVYCLQSGESLILTATLNGEASAMTSAVTVTFPISRFVINKKLNSRSPPSNFRNLGELSILLKNKIFLPLRNEIYRQSSCDSPYPSLEGCPADVLLEILKYLKLSDIASLAAVCKKINDAAVPYLLRNKSKKGLI